MSRLRGWLPPWARSVRLRFTVLYSTVLFLLAALLVGSLYLGLSLSLRHEPVSSGAAVRVTVPSAGDRPGGRTFVDVREFESKVNEHTLAKLRTFSFAALGALFVASLAVGWLIAGRALSPIARITAVAKEIQATNLARRIALDGPDDELKRLADTFDSMLERLESAFAAQRQFVADASHELRNPIAIIRTNLDLALSAAEATDESRRRAAAVIVRTLRRMSRLTDDLLALARLESPQRLREQVALHGLLGEAGDDFRAAAELRGIEIEIEGDREGCVVGDRDLLKRALANLLDNAVRLAPEGSRVRLSAGSDAGWSWLAVSDEGPGIPPEAASRIFTRFTRAGEAPSRGQGGAGLGLAIVRQVAESHGGGARMFPGRQGGSTFVVWLPADRGAAEAPSFDPTAPRPEEAATLTVSPSSE